MSLLAEATRTVDSAGVVVPLSARGPLIVSFDGQHVWSFRPALDGVPTPRGWFVAWPAMLMPYLHGRARVAVIGFNDGTVYADTEVQLGSGDERISVRDRLGNPLAVNKVGTLSRAFLAADGVARAEIVAGARAILADLDDAGASAYLNYGALLGAVREGVMIGHDCDVDLCYVSVHDNPVDVILESYRLERAMRARGRRTVRMSGADFKVVLELSDGRRENVDVFAAFHVGGRFFQLGNRSGSLPREAIVPFSTVTLEGVEFPAPADPEAMLAFLYGDGWRVPDPSFRYADPPEGIRRLDGWLRGFRSEQPRWNRWYVAHGSTVPRGRSDFARWVRRRIPVDAVVADLGCGMGRDTAYFARRGHRVIGYEWSVAARTRTRARLRGRDGEVRRWQANELRLVVAEGASLALSRERTGKPVVLYARHLVGCLDKEGRANLWRMARMVGGSVFLELATGPGDALPHGLHRRIDASVVVEEAGAFGARVVERSDGPGFGMFDEPDPAITRLHLSFASPRNQEN